MTTATQLSEPATVVISHRVAAANEVRYRQWLSEIDPACKSAEGHLDTTVIAPIAGISKTYSVIIRFDSRLHLLRWMESPQRRALIEIIRPYLMEDDKYVVANGLECWFTPEGVKAKIPVKWKQFLMTWSAIYPLVVCVPLLLNPAFKQINLDATPLLSTLIVTAIIVALMVYIVMPRYTRFLHDWLYS